MIRLTEEALAAAPGAIVRGGSLRRLGRMLACCGEFERAREMYREGMDISREAGLLVEAAAAGLGMGYIELRAGDSGAAVEALRAGIAELETLGDRGYHPTLCGDLARVLIERGAEGEAAEWTERARETTGPSDLATIAFVEALDGYLFVRRGEQGEGERLARNAVELVAESDFYELLGDSRLFLARTLAVCGKADEARERAEEALRIYEAKGDRPAAGWAQDLLDSLPG